MIFHLYGDVTIASKELQNLGLCSALMTFEQGGIFIVPHLLSREESLSCHTCSAGRDLYRATPAQQGGIFIVPHLL
jgi:hypothetical protein